jgi:hypothetical protein
LQVKFAKSDNPWDLEPKKDVSERFALDVSKGAELFIYQCIGKVSNLHTFAKIA